MLGAGAGKAGRDSEKCQIGGSQKAVRDARPRRQPPAGSGAQRKMAGNRSISAC